jgi:hypothetical protein
MRFIGNSADMIAWNGDKKKLKVFDGAHSVKCFLVNDFIKISTLKVQDMYSCRL